METGDRMTMAIADVAEDRLGVLTHGLAIAALAHRVVRIGQL